MTTATTSQQALKSVVLTKKTMNNEQKIKIAESCGLIFDKMIKDDGDEYPHFLGIDKQWKAYEEEFEHQELIYESDLQEARRMGITDEPWPDKVEDIKL